MCDVDIFSQKDILYLIFENLDFKTICKCKIINKRFKEILDEVDRTKYDKLIYEPFYQYKTFIYDFILTNVMYLTMNENAQIYFEFLQKVYDLYGIVFIREIDFVSSSFSFMVLFYPFLENKHEYDKLCEKLRKYLFIRSSDLMSMDKTLIKEHIEFKYNDLFTNDDMDSIREKELIELLC